VLLAALPVRFVLRSDQCPQTVENFLLLGSGSKGACRRPMFEHRRLHYMQQGAGVYESRAGALVAAGDVHGEQGRGGECAVDVGLGGGSISQGSFRDESHAVATANAGALCMA